MPQIFGRKSNDLSKLSLLFIVMGALGLLLLGDRLQRAPYVTEVNLIKDQPVPFSHQHHVAGLGIDCRYCHTAVERSASAGIPPTSTCMNCHSQVWTDSPMLAPVRDSLKNDTPIPWVRVNDLPDFVHFNHSVHVAKGIGCTSCHGQVDKMDLTYKTQTLYMGWCLECHRHPEQSVRDKKEIYRMDWRPRQDQINHGLKLLEANHVTQGVQNCSVCHY